jgi:putative transposase
MQAYRFRLNVQTREAQTFLSRTVGCCRFVWNRAVALSEQKYPGFKALCAMLPQWKRELPWLAEVDSIALQQSLRNFDRAWQNFFSNPDHFDRPTFKKRFARDTFRIVGGAAAKAEKNRVWVPKLGWLSFRESRAWQGKVTSVTFSRKAGKWYVSLQCAVEVAEPVKRDSAWLGIDVGISQYATLSDGTHYEGVNAFKQNQLKLARLQRSVARRVKGSNRRKKAVLRVARMHHRIANMRADRAHQVSSELVKNHGRIRIEDLRLVNMMKSAKGTLENPGTHVAAKSGLNRRLADQGLRIFRSFIEYKLSWSGGVLEAVDPRYTSQTCNACKHTAKESRPTQAKFVCIACGHTDHADVNAAKNIRDTGTAAGVSRSERTQRRRRRPAVEAYTPTAA